MHRRATFLAVAVALAVPGVAAADRAGPALDLTIGAGIPPGAEAEGGVYSRAGAGIQVGRIAGMVHGELFSMTPADATLDSTNLRGSGLGGSVRVDLARKQQYYLHAQAGMSWRRLRGNEEVRRACGVFGTCAAGFYTERPDYHDIAPFLAIGVGVRGRGDIYPGFGAQLGFGEMTIDRPGTGPDAHGAIIWLSFQFVIGSDR
jgi:hypothetical protein